MPRSAVVGALLLVTFVAIALAQPRQPPPPPAPERTVSPTPNVGPTAVTLALKSVRTSCATDEVVALDFCTTTNTCTTTKASCFPYKCQGSTGCTQACAGNGDCSGGFACQKGKCVVPRAFCEGNVSKNMFGGSRNCAPYLCDGATGECRAQTCTSVDDCSKGNVCDGSTHKCIPTPKK